MFAVDRLQAHRPLHLPRSCVGAGRARLQHTHGITQTHTRVSFLTFGMKSFHVIARDVIIQHRCHYTCNPALPSSTLMITHHIIVNQFHINHINQVSQVCRLQRREPSQVQHGSRLGLLALFVLALPSLRFYTSPTRLIPPLLLKGPARDDSSDSSVSANTGHDRQSAVSHTAEP